MEPIDKNYLQLQFWNKVYQKSATEFQGFFEDIMQKAFSDFQKIRPYGNQGDRGNDGYRPDAGIYYQVYAPIKPREKEAEAAKKLIKDFKTLKIYWDQISKIKTFYFVFNDKGGGVGIEIENALAELKGTNPHIDFKKLVAKNLEDIFFKLNPDQILALGFDIDSRNALRVVHESLAKLDIDLDRDNGKFVLKALENHKDIIFSMQDENLFLEYEIKECRAFQKVEKVKQAKQKYENLCTRYPNDPRAFLYLAEIHLNNEDFEKNEALLKEAERIDSSHWLLALEKLFREYRLGNQINATKIDVQSFPIDLKVKSNFYRSYAALLGRDCDQAIVDAFIERAISLNPEKLNNYLTRLSILEGRILVQVDDSEKFSSEAAVFISEIDALQEKAKEWGGLNSRHQATLNLTKINVFRILENIAEIERLAKESFELIMQCYFDYLIDNLLVGLLRFIELPLRDFERLLQYLQGAEKSISASLARMLVVQFNLKTILITEGKKFFEAIKKKDILDFIDNLDNQEYDKAWIFLKDDLNAAVAIANTAKQFPDLRKKIIEKLPDDGCIQKEKLRLLLNYDEMKINEAFEILRNLDLSKLSYFECKSILEIAEKKEAWDFVVQVVEKLLKYEKNERIASQLKLKLFSANVKLEKFPAVIQIGEGILSDRVEMAYLNDHNKEVLLGKTLIARLTRGEYQKAKDLLEEHLELAKSIEFKVGIEGEVYLKNGDANKALASVVAGIKTIKSPTPEQYGSLFLIFSQIGSLIDLTLNSREKVEADCFVKFKDQERWYFVGASGELDASKISPTDEKYSKLFGKKIGENVDFDEKYCSNTIRHFIENILPIEKYIHWQCLHHAQKLSSEHRWNAMELIEVPKTEGGIDTKYIIARLEDERKKRGSLFDIYCRENVPLAFLATNEGSLTNAIARIANENKGFVKFSSGDLAEINQQKEVAKRIISGETFYIDGTSAFVLSESGLLEKIYEHLPNLKVPQSVITLLLEIEGKFRYIPGQIGHMGYAQGKLTFLPIDRDKDVIIQTNFENSIKILEAKPQNISAISAANKMDCFSEQEILSELCDACVLAQKDNVPILTEDFLYLKANEFQTTKNAPEYCSTFAIVKVLYEQKKVNFEQFLDYFFYLSNYRFRFLHLSIEDIEKAVFGDGTIISVKPERIKWFNFQLTLSEQYGVPFANAFSVVAGFLIRVLIDDAILPDMVEKIFGELLFAFPTNMDKKTLKGIFLKNCNREINEIQKTIIIGARVKNKMELLLHGSENYNAKNNLWLPK